MRFSKPLRGALKKNPRRNPRARKTASVMSARSVMVFHLLSRRGLVELLLAVESAKSLPVLTHGFVKLPSGFLTLLMGFEILLVEIIAPQAGFDILPCCFLKLLLEFFDFLRSHGIHLLSVKPSYLRNGARPATLPSCDSMAFGLSCG
ncbi:hypothetical protein [Kitasatospora sp. NPDC005856]|uniref:hypothetical protein n=1 Tax=Kitasatospora sp. NPDC005856 TaxID=3154566 RepID=UPI0033D1CC86